MAQSKPAPNDARRTALALLGDVLDTRRLLSEALPGRLAPLPPQDRARAQRLATMTLRHLERCDRMLGPHLKKRPPLRVMNILRLATAELCIDGAAPHGVVHAAVETARAHRKSAGMAGLVNAVLRKVASTAKNWPDLPTPKLPKWLRKPLIDDYTKPVVEAMEAVHAATPPLDLTAKTDPAALAKQLDGVLLPTGSVRLTNAGQVSALPGYDLGAWWVQDAAAALPARLLAPKPGDDVLDLCAAPGGKTLQLAASGAHVTAVDISETRMARVAENLARTGLHATLVTADARSFDGGPYDAVLLDAPCTATGTIRRHPDLPQAKDGSDFPALFALQEELIDKALTLLKPGGRLVYCTCSLLFDEGEEQIRDALARHPGLKTDPDALDIAGIEPDWITAEGGLRLRPDLWAAQGGLDGFYIAILRRDG